MDFQWCWSTLKINRIQFVCYALKSLTKMRVLKTSKRISSSSGSRSIESTWIVSNTVLDA